MNYPLTFYTDKIKHAGEARGPVVLIKPQYKEDKGLHEHEFVHVRQWLVVTIITALVCFIIYTIWLDEAFGSNGLLIFAIAPTTHGLLYKFSRNYRLYCEVEAYKLQAKYYSDDRRSVFGKFIAEDYDLDITQKEATKLLQ